MWTFRSVSFSSSVVAQAREFIHVGRNSNNSKWWFGVISISQKKRNQHTSCSVCQTKNDSLKICWLLLFFFLSLARSRSLYVWWLLLPVAFHNRSSVCLKSWKSRYRHVFCVHTHTHTFRKMKQRQYLLSHTKCENLLSFANVKPFL